MIVSKNIMTKKINIKNRELYKWILKTSLQIAKKCSVLAGIVVDGFDNC